VTDHSSTEDGASPVLEIRIFLVADIRGYARFTLDHGDEAAGRLAGRFAAVAGEVIEHHNGAILEIRADEILAVFGSTRRALCASVALQSRVS
jgi:class 3 adenylate cyclase